jgi:hypothetical protein
MLLMQEVRNGRILLVLMRGSVSFVSATKFVRSSNRTHRYGIDDISNAAPHTARYE